MAEQLELELGLATAPAVENPNAHFFTADGEPRRLLWCSDAARLSGICPYVGEKQRYRPHGGCCFDLEAAGRGIPF